MAHKTNHEKNLKPVRTTEEARKRGRNGGKASGKSRAALKTFKQSLLDGLTQDEIDIMIDAQKRNAKRGNLPSFEFMLKMVGQHPDQTNDVDNSITIHIEGCDEYGD